MRIYHSIEFLNEIWYHLNICGNISCSSAVILMQLSGTIEYDRGIKKKDLYRKVGISSVSVTKMGRNGYVTTEILLKICIALDCGIEDIMEILPDE